MLCPYKISVFHQISVNCCRETALPISVNLSLKPLVSLVHSQV